MRPPAPSTGFTSSYNVPSATNFTEREKVLQERENIIIEERMESKILGVMDVTVFHILATLSNMRTTFGYQTIFCLGLHSKGNGANQIFHIIHEEGLNQKTFKLVLVLTIFKKDVEKQIRPSLPDVFWDSCIPTQLTKLVEYSRQWLL